MLISLADWARRRGKDPRTARNNARRGCFSTAQKIGRDWLIDEDEEFVDRRVRSGKYIDARRAKKAP